MLSCSFGITKSNLVLAQMFLDFSHCSLVAQALAVFKRKLVIFQFQFTLEYYKLAVNCATRKTQWRTDSLNSHRPSRCKGIAKNSLDDNPSPLAQLCTGNSYVGHSRKSLSMSCKFDITINVPKKLNCLGAQPCRLRDLLLSSLLFETLLHFP